MSLIRKTYYHFKPFLPLRLRLGVRRQVASHILSRSGNIWPIKQCTQRAPRDWPGWPGGKRFAFVLTHDVESSRGVARTMELANLEAALGFRSSFNFIPEGDYRTPARLRSELESRGFEIGVHDLHHNGKLYSSRRDFQFQAKKINGYIRSWNAAGFRSGFMHHNLEWLHDLDISYDMSTFDTDPFEPQPDGADTIFPFWVPSTPAQPPHVSGPAVRRAGYLELPYTLPQDSTLFLLLEQDNIDVWKRKLDWIADNGGMALLNVHPDYIAFDDKRSSFVYPVRFYKEFLEYARSRYGQDAWFAVPREVAGHCAAFRPLKACVDGEHLSISTPAVKLRPLLDSYSNPESSPCGRLNGDHAKIPAAAESSVLAGKRVAVVVFSYYPSDPRVRREAEAMAEAGAEIDVFCLKNPDELSFERVNGIGVYRLPLERQRSGKLRYFYQYGYFLALIFFRLSLRNIKKRYDLVHVHNMPDVLVFAAGIPKLFGAKVILDLHDPTPEVYITLYNLDRESAMVRFLNWVEQRSIGFADLAITPNVAFKDVFVQRGCPPGKMIIVMNSPQTEVFSKARSEFTPSPRRAGEFRLMFHGSLLARHGLEDLVNAIAAVRSEIPLVRLDIYGARTPHVAEIEALVASLNLQDHVRYHGGRALEQIARLILDTDLGIIPNKRTPFTEINMPTRIFEYLAMGKPVIAPRTKGVRDYFADDQIIFFEPGNVPDLAQKIRWAAQNPAEIKRTVAAGQAVFSKYDWESQRAALLASASAILNPNL